MSVPPISTGVPGLTTPGLKRVQRQPQQGRRQHGERALALAYVGFNVRAAGSPTGPGGETEAAVVHDVDCEAHLGRLARHSVPIFNAAGA